ncbi:MAG: flavin-containing monooxygenase, partial [Mycobacterium sp.]
MNVATAPTGASVPSTVDVVVVGAGFAGLYALHRLRGDGLTVQLFEAADDVGGVWYWNRYPGARCDVESVDYSYSFDDDLQHEWDWSEKYATQPEILRYIRHVADRFDLRRDIKFGTRVTDVVFDEATVRWQVHTDADDVVSARFIVLAVGPLSNANIPDIEGLDSFTGEVYHTGRWPHEDIDFTGKRVGVIGTGSSGIQAIPCVAKQAEQLYVFQRTANYSVPAGNVPLEEETRREQKATYAERRRLSMLSGGGSPHQAHPKSAVAVSDEERQAAYERRWQLGGVLFSKTFPDQMVTIAANDTARLFWEDKVRAVIDDPAVADLLIPNDHPIGTKRICTDDNYYQTFNLP